MLLPTRLFSVRHRLKSNFGVPKMVFLKKNILVNYFTSVLLNYVNET